MSCYPSIIKILGDRTFCFLEVLKMSIWKVGKWLGVFSIGAGLVNDKIKNHEKKKRQQEESDNIDNLERLYNLKKIGAITDEDFEEFKERYKQKIKYGD